MTEPQNPMFSRKVKRQTPVVDSVTPESLPVQPQPQATRVKKGKSGSADSTPHTTAAESSITIQTLQALMQQMQELQHHTNALKEVGDSRRYGMGSAVLSQLSKHWPILAALVGIACFYGWQRTRVEPDRPDPVISVVERLPDTLAEFYVKDQASKAAVLREISEMTFEDDPTKLKWFNDTLATRLSSDVERLTNDFAEILHAGKTLEAAEALE